MSEMQDYASRLSDPESRKFETFSYLPALDDEAIRKRVKEEPRRNDIREQALENRSRRLAGL